MEHTIPIGTLVEVSSLEENFNGIRLFVTAHRYDADGTPLYSLGIKGETEISRMFHGHPVECLRIIQ